MASPKQQNPLLLKGEGGVEAVPSQPEGGAAAPKPAGRAPPFSRGLLAPESVWTRLPRARGWELGAAAFILFLILALLVNGPQLETPTGRLLAQWQLPGPLLPSRDAAQGSGASGIPGMLAMPGADPSLESAAEAPEELHPQQPQSMEVLRRGRGQGDRCWSRREMPLLLRWAHRPSRNFQDRITSFQAMHQRCTAHSAWADFNSSGIEDSLEGCQYLVFKEDRAGLGNRLLGLVSAFAYALLSNRAFLIAPGGNLGNLLCNPFENTPWVLSDEQWANVTSAVSQESDRDRDLRLDPLRRWSNGSIISLDLSHSNHRKDTLFFCQETQNYVLRKIRVAVYNSGQHNLPAFHLEYRFDETLRTWFPQGYEFLHFARHLILPANDIWHNITSYYEENLQSHCHLVGVQVRQFQKPDEECVDERVRFCLSYTAKVLEGWMPQDQLLLERGNTTARAKEAPTGVKSTGFFFTSLNGSHADALAEFVRGRVSPAGEVAAVHKLSSENWQKETIQQHRVALQEMVLLSFSNVLLTSFFSTFGNIASGIAGGPTFLMNIVNHFGNSWRDNGLPECVRVSPEPCEHKFPVSVVYCNKEWINTASYSPDVGACDALNIGLQYHRPRV